MVVGGSEEDGPAFFSRDTPADINTMTEAVSSPLGAHYTRFASCFSPCRKLNRRHRHTFPDKMSWAGYVVAVSRSELSADPPTKGSRSL